MAAYEYYEPLRAVPPIDDTQGRFAVVLWLRERARRVYGAAVTAFRRAASYAAHLAERLHLTGALAWLRGQAVRLWRPIGFLSARFGRSGLTAALVAVAASPRGQAAMGYIAGRAVRAAGWVARAAHSLIDRSLRLFGKPGQRAADRLLDLAAAAALRIATFAVPVLDRLRRLSDPQTAHVRLVGGLARSFLLHRALRLLVANPFARFVVEGLVSAAALDTRISSWVRALFRQLRVRYSSIRAQAQLVDLRRKNTRGTRGTGVTTLPPKGGEPKPTNPLAMPKWVADGAMDDAPQPSNRAERRIHEREQQRRKRNRPNNP